MVKGFLIFKVRHPVINCVGFSFYLLWGDYSNEFKFHLLPTENGSGLQVVMGSYLPPYFY